MSRPLTPWLYSTLRALFGAALLGIWAFVGTGRAPDELLFVRQALLCFATFQIFEGLARYQAEPTLGSLSPLAREGAALAVSIALSVMDGLSTKEAEFDYDLSIPPGGTAALIVLFAAVVHFFAARARAEVSARFVRRRLGLAGGPALFTAGLVLASAGSGLRVGARAHEVLSVFILVLVGALLTMPWSWRAWRIHARHGEDLWPDIRERVQAATHGDGKGGDHLFQLRYPGASMHTFVEFRSSGERELAVPASLVVLIKRGDWLLVSHPRIVTSARGGRDYRGADEYERLEGFDEAFPLGELPLPSAPRRRPHPLYVEAGLAVGTAVFCVAAMFLIRFVYP